MYFSWRTQIMRFSLCRATLSLFIGLLLGASAVADVTLPSVLGSSMVLQRDMKIPIWGKADPGEKVTVEIGKQCKSTYTGADGHWMLHLRSMKAGGPYEMTITGKNRISLKDILIGEVWVCSGQSNMQWAVKQSKNSKEEIAKSNYPQIRLFYVTRTLAATPQWDCVANWTACSPQTSPNFSAVAYFFGREICKTQGVPVGLIHTSWGGTPVESWTSMPVLEANPMAAAILERFNKGKVDVVEKYAAAVKKWQAAYKKAKKAKKKLPRKPRTPFGHPGHPRNPSCLYNAMISPLLPYGIRGAIWYQGESNASRSYQYGSLFPEMIKDWRNRWDQGAFPFLFVQLANFRVYYSQHHEAWAELRESQTNTLSLPRTGMAVTIDIGEAGNIHPLNKQDVGKRLALWAQATVYKQSVVYSGPLYKSMRKSKGTIKISFDHLGGGLVAHDGSPRGFTIAGKDRKFYKALAKIDGNRIIVWSDEVPNPVSVRYGWLDYPDCNIYNKAGLPASPFRTDEWPGVTYEAR
jgi:sialate O-acetylesterase